MAVNTGHGHMSTGREQLVPEQGNYFSWWLDLCGKVGGGGSTIKRELFSLELKVINPTYMHPTLIVCSTLVHQMTRHTFVKLLTLFFL
jgi:hypothetical protein